MLNSSAIIGDFRQASTGAQVDILIVNCSLFNPTPSLSAMLVNHFKMKSSVVSYNLSGMGCSAGVIAISLARELLQVIALPRPVIHAPQKAPQEALGLADHRSQTHCTMRQGL